MGRVDAMLKMLVDQGGDTLELRRGKPPGFLADGRSLRLFFPDMNDALWTVVVDPLLQATSGGAPYVAASAGGFDVDVRSADHVVLSRQAGAPRPAPAREPLPPPRVPRPRAPIPGEPVEVLRGPEPPMSVASAVTPTPEPATARAAAPPPAQGGSALGWLTKAMSRGASDLHVSEGDVPMVRVDGRLMPLSGAGVAGPDLFDGLMDDEARRHVQAGGSYDGALSLADGTRVRVHAYRHDGGRAVALRVLRRAAPELGTLGLPPSLHALVDAPHGLILVCGPTGSGKSTTLAALAREALRRRRGLLVTLEDPIEYVFQADLPGAIVRQRQVGRDVADFATGLRETLRQDPDVILMGEMRDAESIALALTAAETGHLVFASLHAPTSASSVERIVDAYPPERQRQIRVQLADVLRAVITQRLLPRSDGHGRVPAVEILLGTHAVGNLIREGRTPQLASAIQTGRELGMIPLDRSLRDLVQAGVVDAEEADRLLPWDPSRADVR